MIAVQNPTSRKNPSGKLIKLLLPHFAGKERWITKIISEYVGYTEKVLYLLNEEINTSPVTLFIDTRPADAYFYPGDLVRNKITLEWAVYLGSSNSNNIFFTNNSG